MSASILSVVYLFLAMGAFAGIVFWAYGRKRKKHFEQEGKLPLDHPDRPSGEG